MYSLSCFEKKWSKYHRIIWKEYIGLNISINYKSGPEEIRRWWCLGGGSEIWLSWGKWFVSTSIKYHDPNSKVIIYEAPEYGDEGGQLTRLNIPVEEPAHSPQLFHSWSQWWPQQQWWFWPGWLRYEMRLLTNLWPRGDEPQCRY